VIFDRRAGRPRIAERTPEPSPRGPELARCRALVYRIPVAATYRELLNVTDPSLEKVKHHPEAHTYALLLVALVEHGGPMTLADVAARFDAAGIAPADEALASLRRCRPARAPIYREGDTYCLDPHDKDADLWMFRLGLRPAEVSRTEVVRPAPPPLPGPDVPLTLAELDQAWKGAAPMNTLSARRIVLALLDAHGGPMSPEDVVAGVTARARWHTLTADSAKFQQRGSPIVVDDQGRWAIAPDAAEALKAARGAVRQRLDHASPSAQAAADLIAYEVRREARRAELAKLRHVVAYAYPPGGPGALALLDIEAHTIDTFLGDEITAARARLAGYDVIAGLDVHALLRGIGVDLAGLRLAELGPPQKSKKINKSGRTLKITADLLIRGTCGISRPFDPEGLQRHLAAGDLNKARRRLEADVKSLYALYQYGRLHGELRLRWGFIDERLSAPWVDFDEWTLGGLMKHAHTHDLPLEIVVGSAPGWADPWSRAFLARVLKGSHEWDLYLVHDATGSAILRDDVQLARLAAPPQDPSRPMH
jgi:hypothetical protein